MITPFHLAIPVSDIQTARAFYGGLLGCAEGRSSDQWVDFNLFGHQLVCHQVCVKLQQMQRRRTLLMGTMCPCRILVWC